MPRGQSHHDPLWLLTVSDVYPSGGDASRGNICCRQSFFQTVRSEDCQGQCTCIPRATAVPFPAVLFSASLWKPTQPYKDPRGAPPTSSAYFKLTLLKKKKERSAYIFVGNKPCDECHGREVSVERHRAQ